MYSCMSLWFSESRYSMVATSWLPSSSSTALLKKMMRSRYCSRDSLRVDCCRATAHLPSVYSNIENTHR